MKLFIIFITNILITVNLYSQSETNSVLSLKEYLAYVKSNHPYVKQANLILDAGDIKLMKARGAFDPKLEIDYDKKEFKETEYYDKLNASFKIPTYYGIELKAGYEENDGVYLNPENKTPDSGLYQVGISMSLAKNLFINKRMAMLKKAKLFQKQSEFENQIAIASIIHEAIINYFSWLQSYQTKELYTSYLKNAEVRLQGIKKSYDEGDRPAIDTLESKITVRSRKLSLEKARINHVKNTLLLSNFLWINGIPMELKETIIPDFNVHESIDDVLNITPNIINELNIDNHPKIQSLGYKYESLEVEKKLKRNNLLPKVEAQYNFLSSETAWNTLTQENYKLGIGISLPLFLRKERADLKQAKLDLKEMELEISAVRFAIQNKNKTLIEQIDSYQEQWTISKNIQKDYETLFKAEERKFDLGESSVFLVNARESKLLDATLKNIEAENSLLLSKAEIFKLWSVNLLAEN